MKKIYPANEENRDFFQPDWSVKEMEYIAELSAVHNMHPINFIRQAVEEWDKAQRCCHSTHYILEDANPEKLAKACGLPIGVIVAALENILPESSEL
jgi:acetoin utilization deacetylase AcuC-like enzyme